MCVCVCVCVWRWGIRTIFINIHVAVAQHMIDGHVFRRTARDKYSEVLLMLIRMLWIPALDSCSGFLLWIPAQVANGVVEQADAMHIV